MKLLSIAKERAACEAAWAAVPDAVAGVHIHHEDAAEALTEPIAHRIAYIASDKPKKEQALRYRLMRPITAEQLAEYKRVEAAARAEYQRVEAAALARVKAAALAEQLAEYKRVTVPALAEYKRVVALIHATICPTTDCPFDGKSIFA